MAVVVGLVLGAVAGLRSWNIAGRRLVVLPVVLAGVEIAVNTARFGASAVAIWGVTLLVLAAGVTLAARAAAARWTQSHAH